MKTLKLTLVAVLMAASLFGQATLTLAPGSVSPGGTVALNLSIADNGTQPAGVQFTLTYPTANVTAISVAPGAAATAAAKSISCAGSGGSLICLATGINTNIIADGVLAVVSLTMASTPGNVNIGMTGTLSASLAGNAITTTGTGSAVSVFSPFDLNRDGKVDILDLQQLINAIFAQQVSADLNKDGKEDVIDAQLLVNAALHP